MIYSNLNDFLMLQQNGKHVVLYIIAHHKHYLPYSRVQTWAGADGAGRVVFFSV